MLIKKEKKDTKLKAKKKRYHKCRKQQNRIYRGTSQIFKEYFKQRKQI